MRVTTDASQSWEACKAAMAGAMELVHNEVGLIVAAQAPGMKLDFSTVGIQHERATNKVLLMRATGAVDLGRVGSVDVAAFGAALALCGPDDEMLQMSAETAATEIERAIFGLVAPEAVASARDEELVKRGLPAGPVPGFEEMERTAVRALVDAPRLSQHANVATLVDVMHRASTETI